MVIKHSAYVLSIYVNNGLRHCEIGKKKKTFFLHEQKRLNYVPDSFEVRSLLLLSSSLKIEEFMQAIDINSWLEYLISQNELLFFVLDGICVHAHVYMYCICRYLM